MCSYEGDRDAGKHFQKKKKNPSEPSGPPLAENGYSTRVHSSPVVLLTQSRTRPGGRLAHPPRGGRILGRVYFETAYAADRAHPSAASRAHHRWHPAFCTMHVPGRADVMRGRPARLGKSHRSEAPGGSDRRRSPLVSLSAGGHRQRRRFCARSTETDLKLLDAADRSRRILPDSHQAG